MFPVADFSRGCGRNPDIQRSAPKGKEREQSGSLTIPMSSCWLALEVSKRTIAFTKHNKSKRADGYGLYLN